MNWQLIRVDFKSLFVGLLVITMICTAILIPIWVMTNSIGVPWTEFVIITVLYILIQPLLASFAAITVLFCFKRYKLENPNDR